MTMQPTVERPTQPIEQMLDKLGVQAVFGAPIVQAEVTVIPVAQVVYGFGYGSGYGHDHDQATGADASTGATGAGPATPAAEGGGSGAGAGGRAIPCGYIRIGPEGVTYEPIADNTRIPLAGILLAAWAIFWVTATIRTITKAIAKTRQLKHKQ